MARRPGAITPERLEELMTVAMKRRHQVPRTTPTIFNPDSFQIWGTYLALSRDLADSVPSLIEHIRKLENRLREVEALNGRVAITLREINEQVNQLVPPEESGVPLEMDDDF